MVKAWRTSRQLVTGGLGLLALGWTTSAWASPFDPADTSWQGCTELVALARKELGERLVLTRTLDWTNVRPSDAVLVVHPDWSLSADSATAFLEAGGHLALLDDYGTAAALLPEFGVERVDLPAQPLEMLRFRPELPVAVAVPRIETAVPGAGGVHPALGQAQRLALNHATGFRHRGLTPVLRVRAQGAADVDVAVAASVGQGHLFAMGDPSVVTNQMLRYDGNRSFALGLLRYLAGARAGEGLEARAPGQGRVFLLTSGASDTGSFQGASPLSHHLRDARQRIEHLARSVRERGFPPWLDLVLGGLCVSLAALYAWATSSRPYLRPSPTFARPLPLREQGGAPGEWASLAGSSPAASANTFCSLRLPLELELAAQAQGSIHASRSSAASGSPNSGGPDVSSEREVQQLLGTLGRAEELRREGKAPTVPLTELAHAVQVVRRVLARADDVPFAPLPPASHPDAPGAPHTVTKPGDSLS